ncbi:pyridoxal phosphate-dependent decarboxylase family protein [Halorubellus litoreus]|uniref:Pyridoxal phosphate-dependent decarboxylase family protein n=1 Tax=Halorubellus litoreus TaxID=755308 RepID=A0ABD5VCU7_9EURY
MDRSSLPDAAFVDPSGANAAAVRSMATDVLDQLLDQLAAAEDRPPLPADPTPPAVDVPDDPRDAAALKDALEGIVDGSMNPAHPGYIGHMDTMPTTASVLGDLVAAAVNNNMLSAEMSPVFTELEAELTALVATAFGLGADAGGVMTSGGSLANLQALAVARNRAFDVADSGLAATSDRPVAFASAAAHTSLQKSAMLLGLGSDAIVPVETDEHGRMRPAALEDAIARASEVGKRPFCVVATAGTTTTGNVDPLDELATVAARHDLWFHVDAAYGGALAFADDDRGLLDGIERADSVTFNPQKWCYVAKTCAMVLFADREVLDTDFRIGAPYMRAGEQRRNLGELSVQGTRHADVLKLWLTFQHLGRSGLAALVEESYRLTALVRDGVAAREELALATDPELNVVCFRAAPDWCDSSEYDALNDALQVSLLEDADVFVSLPTYRERKWLRAVLLNPYTTDAVVDGLFEHVDEFLSARRPR